MLRFQSSFKLLILKAIIIDIVSDDLRSLSEAAILYESQTFKLSDLPFSFQSLNLVEGSMLTHIVIYDS